MKKYTVTLEFTEPLLGTVPKDRDAAEVIITAAVEKSKNMDPEDILEEMETAPVENEKGHTGFHKDDNGMFLYDYQIKGFFKEAANIVKENVGVKNARAKIEDYLFVEPRRIYLGKSQPDGVIVRALRAMTMRGPRNVVTKSDFVAAGTQIKFTIVVLNPKIVPDKLVRECLEYGKYRGIGQWRGGSYGRFTYSLED